MQPPREPLRTFMQRRERRMRRFARQEWIWLAFAVFCAAMMVLYQLVGNRVMLVPCAFGLALGLSFYLAAGYIRRRLASQDVARIKGERRDP